ncbi:MAG: Ig-like domain-containing protein [Deltaproteobacteria bacterium]|nr:Ig-like domain-containing protein [Deltaproteobacteria bacterium]
MTMKHAGSIVLSCVVTVISLFFCPLVFAAGTDALLQGAVSDYNAMKDALVKQYEEQYKRGEELDRQYYQANRKDTIRNQVQAWQQIVTDGYAALFGFLKSEDFDKAHIIDSDNYFNEALRKPVSYKSSWPAEIGPALSAVQRCCSTEDSNECRYQILQKALPYYRDLANKIEEQIGGFFRSVDQGKLSYYDDYYKKTQRFTYTWPANAERLLNFFKGANYNQELQSRKISGSGFRDASLLTVNLRSTQGRLLTMYVTLEAQDYSRPDPWLRALLEDGAVIEEGSNYLVLKRENRYYRLVHFYKERKSLAVVYTLETDRTVDAMVRYLILALRDYVVSGAAAPAPAPAPGPSPAASRRMELKLLTSANLQTSPGLESTCTLQVIVAGPTGQPMANAVVVLEKPGLGTLSVLQLTTDAQGKAQVIYTAPTEEEMAPTGKKEVSVTVNAHEAASGVKDSATLTIRSRTSAITAQVEHTILPAHPDFYNTIQFRFQAADRKDGSPYQARIQARQQGGALVKDSLQQGGVQSYEMAVWPRQEYAVSYHWVGPASMMRAADETITIEIPELGLKKEVTFSVGIDLAVVSVQRKYGGTLFPLLWEPFHVYLTDRFHPDVDLAALLDKFRIQPGLAIEQTSYAPAPVDPAQTGFLSALFTRLEGSALGSLHDAVIWDGGQWEAQKTHDNRFVLIQKGRHEDGRPWIDYPAIVFWERGSYQFKVTLKPGAFDADPRTNTALTEVFTIEEFRGIGDEVVHTVFLPSIEFLAGALAGYTQSLPLKFAFCVKGLAGDAHAIQQPQATTGATIDSYTNFLSDAWGCCMDVMGASNLPASVKQLFDNHTLALYVKTLCDTLVGDKPAGTIKGQARAEAPGQSAAGYDLARILEIARLAVKGSKGSYLVILERNGLQRYAAEIAGGGALTPAPAKLAADQSPAQRIEEGDRFIVIPAHASEKLMLQLSGSGAGGQLILVTTDAATRYAYSQTPWQSTVAIDATGKPAFTQGAVLTPAP